jgi:hypothetical protein
LYKRERDRKRERKIVREKERETESLRAAAVSWHQISQTGTLWIDVLS